MPLRPARDAPASRFLVALVAVVLAYYHLRWFAGLLAAAWLV